MRRRLCLLLLLVLVLALLGTSGCATVEEHRAQHREEMLLRAGFEKKPAETDAQRRQLEQLPARRLVRVPFEDQTRYVYSDADFCVCLYVGTEAASEQFLLALAREFIDTEYADSGNPDPVVSADEMAHYEDLARKAVLDPTAHPSLDWSAWH